MEYSASILGAFDAHKLPSQDQTNAWIDLVVSQLDDATETVANSSGKARLSSHGRTLATDLKRLLLAYKELGAHKNGDDQLQNAIWNLSEGQINLKADPNAAKSEAANDAQEASSALQNMLLIFWRHFTSLDGGAGGLASLTRNVLADTAEVVEHQAGAAKVQLRETEDQVQQGERDALGRQGTDDDTGGDPRRTFENRMDSVKTTGSQAIGAKESVKQSTDEVSEKSSRRLEDLLDSILERAQSDPAYRDSVSKVFDLADKWFNKSVDAADNNTIDDFVHDPSGRVSAALRSLNTLAERLADGKSTGDLTQALRAAAVTVREHPDLRSFFDDLNEFVRRTVHEPKYARSEEHAQRRTELRERWEKLQSDDNENTRKWHQDLERLKSEARDYLAKVENDHDVQRLREAHAVLAKDVAAAAATLSDAASGDVAWLWQDVADVVLPRVLESLKQVPIPRMEYKENDVEFVIEDLNISSLALLPGRAHIRNTTDLEASKASPGADVSTSFKSRTQVHLKGVQFTAKDVSFWYNDKSMKPVSEVSGLLGISVPEQGVDIDISLALIPQPAKKERNSDKHAFFTINHVTVSLNNPSIALTKTNHPVLLTTFKPLFRSRLEKSIQTSLEQQIITAIQFVDELAYDVHHRAGVFRDTGMALSTAYFSAVWSEVGHLKEQPGLLSGLQTTSVGVVRDDPRTDVKFAVGAQPQIIAGEKHGPQAPGTDSQTKRKQATRLAEEAKGRKDNAADTNAGAGAGAGVQVAKGVSSFTEEVKIKKEQERQREGWQTATFDAPR